MGIQTKEAELDAGLWRKVIAAAMHRIAPINTPSRPPANDIGLPTTKTNENTFREKRIPNRSGKVPDEAALANDLAKVNINVTSAPTQQYQPPLREQRIPTRPVSPNRPHTTGPNTIPPPTTTTTTQSGPRSTTPPPHSLEVPVNPANYTPQQRPRRNSSIGSAFVKNLPPPPPTDLDLLLDTATDLIYSICDINVGGAVHLWTQLRERVLPALEGATPTPEVETALRALMDYLSAIKQISSEAECSNQPFPKPIEVLEKVTKLVEIFENPNGTSFSVGDFIAQPETRQFWEKYFGKKMYCVTLQQFFHALLTDPLYNFIAAGDDDMLQDLILRLDHNKLGYLVCHRLADFVGNNTLAGALEIYKRSEEPTQGPRNVVPAQSLTQDTLPCLIWVDDHPENNEEMVKYAQELGIHVVLLNGSPEARQYIIDNTSALEKHGQRQIRFITDNVRNGAGTVLDMNAGEELARFVRGRRIKSHILVYCGNLQYAQYTSKYPPCTATTAAATCQQFIEELAQQK